MIKTRNCRTCKYFEPLFPEDVAEDDCPGTCEWKPPALPLSWRYCQREVVGVDAGDTGCETWEKRT